MEKRIFKKNSTSFFTATKLFPKKTRKDVIDLYSFLRVADDYVDSNPAQPEKLNELIALWEESKENNQKSNMPQKSDNINQRVVKNIVRIGAEHKFENEWIDMFLLTMKSDLNFETKKTLKDSLNYCEGSAEVVGLMMSRIMGLSKDLDEQAKLLGRSFQWINFVRDIDEDSEMGRCYFPSEELENFKLKGIDYDNVSRQRTLFKDFVQFHIERYRDWANQAESAFQHIPKRHRFALGVALDHYNWTAKQIYKNPMLVFSKTLFVLKKGAKSIIKV
jgi:15-cis-phytoene synthase